MRQKGSRVPLHKRVKKTMDEYYDARLRMHKEGRVVGPDHDFLTDRYFEKIAHKFYHQDES